MFRTVQVKTPNCPVCQEPLVPLEEDEGPVRIDPGDVVVCDICATILNFTHTYSLEQVSDALMRGYPPELRDRLLALQKQTYETINKGGRFGRH